jgi:hypothetical protein
LTLGTTGVAQQSPAVLVKADAEGWPRPPRCLIVNQK